MARMHFIVEDQELEVNSCRRDGSLHHAMAFIATDRTITYVTKEGKLFSSRINRGGSYGRRWTGYVDLVLEAVKLGVLKRKQGLIKRIAAMAEERKKREHAAHHAQETIRQAELAGVQLTQRQLADLKSKIRRR